MKINNEKNIDAGKSYLKAKYGGALEYNFNGLKGCLTYIVFKGVMLRIQTRVTRRQSIKVMATQEILEL